MSSPPVVYFCEVREVFSGDDLIALVDLGVENLWKRQRLRLAGVDTPPAINALGDTEAGKLRSFVRTLVRGRRAQITIVSRNTNSWVVALVVETHEGWQNVNDILIARGYEFKKQST
jgi:endonuclease YncB( thermonuclease family)